MNIFTVHMGEENLVLLIRHVITFQLRDCLHLLVILCAAQMSIFSVTQLIPRVEMSSALCRANEQVL